MPVNLYDYTVPALLRGLGVLQSYLAKMQAAVDHGQFTEKELLQARLANDMLPLGWQIRIAIDNAKNAPARLTGREPPLFADDEQTFEEYRRRLKKSIAFLQTLTPDAFEDSQTRKIDRSFRRVGSTMAGEDYLRALVLPNFYFHITVAHAILRHKGLRLGKSDYLGALPDVVSAPIPLHTGAHPSPFLTKEESVDWLAKHGIQEMPEVVGEGFSYFQFDLYPLPVKLSDLMRSLLEDLGGYEGGLLLLSDWIWDEEYEGDPTNPYRVAQGESRPLNEAPGLLLDAAAYQDAVALLALIVERRWTGQLYFSSGATTLQIAEGDRMAVYTSNPDAERLVRYRLVVSGSDILPV